MTTVLIDLDGTLLDSRALDGARSAKNWGFVKSSLSLVRPFGTVGFPAHELPGRLKARGYRVGVVTSSPRWYAESLIHAFSIQHDGLVAYDDTTEHKPNPEPLQLAVAKLGGSTDTTCHIGDAPIDTEASHHARIVSIGAGWGVSNLDAFSSSAPDVLLYDPRIMVDATSLADYLYFGDARARAHPPVLHQGSVLRCVGSVPSYALGRYFTAGDERHGKDRLSGMLLTLKNDDGPAKTLGLALADALTYLREIESWTPTYVVSVPPKPEQTRNRFAPVLQHAADTLGARSPLMYSSGMACVRTTEGYKQMGPFNRRIAVKSAYRSQYTWRNEKVLLVDDILTTGATIRECAEVLSASGASEVRALVFGKDQQAFTRKICPDCGCGMKVRTNKSNGNKFWGCSGFRTSGCRRTFSI